MTRTIRKVTLIIQTSCLKSKMFSTLTLKGPVHIAIKTLQLGRANTALEEDLTLKPGKLRLSFCGEGGTFVYS